MDARSWVLLIVVAALVVAFLGHNVQAWLSASEAGLDRTWKHTDTAMKMLLGWLLGEGVQAIVSHAP
jgi:hypothetical protein